MFFLVKEAVFTSVSQKTSILCHSPSSKLFFVFTFSSRVPEPKSISSRGCPLSNSNDIKSKNKETNID